VATATHSACEAPSTITVGSWPKPDITSTFGVSWPNLQNVLMSGLSGQSGHGQNPVSRPQPLKNAKYRCRKATYDLLLDCLMVTIIDQP
jgi:hypothetical protein